MPSNFDPIYSTDNIWREDNMQRSLSDDLNTIESNISTLETNKANSNHTHTGYATSTHTHSYNDLDDKPTIPTTLPANGGNADTVDGKHASDFADATHTHTEITAKYEKPSTGIPKTDLASDVQSSLGKADSALQSYTETDPTVPAWAKAATKPIYTATEVGALPTNTTLADLTGDATHRTVTDAEKTAWNAKSTFSGSYNDLTDKPTIPSTTDFATVSYVDGGLDGKVDKVTGKGLSSNDYTTAERLKLVGIEAGANKTTIDSALSSTSTNPVQNKVINSALAGKAASSHDHSAVTTSAAGFMSADDKTKLDGIAIGANNYTLPNATSSSLGGVKIGSNITVSSGTISLSKANVTSALGYTPFGSGTLSMANGGTGSSQVADAPANAILKKANNGNYVWYIQSKNGALYATSTNGIPQFGVLPVEQGGTGETDAWVNGTVSSLNSTTITSYQFAVFPYLNKAFIRLNVLLGSALGADEPRYIAMPSTVSTAHTALSCFNTSGYDIHCGMASNNGIYIINCGTASMPTSVRLYIAGWYSI